MKTHSFRSSFFRSKVRREIALLSLEGISFSSRVITRSHISLLLRSCFKFSQNPLSELHVYNNYFPRKGGKFGSEISWTKSLYFSLKRNEPNTWHFLLLVKARAKLKIKIYVYSTSKNIKRNPLFVITSIPMSFGWRHHEMWLPILQIISGCETPSFVSV